MDSFKELQFGPVWTRATIVYEPEHLNTTRRVARPNPKFDGAEDMKEVYLANFVTAQGLYAKDVTTLTPEVYKSLMMTKLLLSAAGATVQVQEQLHAYMDRCSIVVPGIGTEQAVSKSSHAERLGR